MDVQDALVATLEASQALADIVADPEPEPVPEEPVG
jgi:hypothetical protein